MTAALELIEMLRERAHVSYEEAREALEKCNNDIVEALIYLEKQDKIKAPQKEDGCQDSFWKKVKRLVKKCHEIKLVISKEDDKIIDLPLTVVIILTIFAAPLMLVGLIVALFAGYKIRIKKPGTQDLKINKTLDDISAAASKISGQVADAINKN